MGRRKDNRESGKSFVLLLIKTKFMSDTKKEEGSVDILLDIRKIEARKKQALLAKKVSELKVLAKKINELKVESEYLIDEMGVSKEDAKRVVDFINELDDVKLTDEEKKEIRNKTKQSVATGRKEVEKEIEKFPPQVFPSNFSGFSTSTMGVKSAGVVSPNWGTTTAGSYDNMNKVYCSARGDAQCMSLQSGTNSLDIKL